MLGAIIGDVVGSRFEFRNIKTKEFNLFDKGCQFTDDSVMSVAVAEMCLDGYVPSNNRMIVQTFKKWGQRYPDAGYGDRFFSWVLSDASEPYNSCGNGSAMRVSAVGFYAKSADEVKKYSKTVTRVTHNHPEGIKGAYVTAMCIYLARKGASKKEIKRFVEKYYDIDFDYEHLRRTYRHEAEICQNTVPQAIFCFLISNGFEDCLRTTISIGGDCDTTAAISCAIAEAYYGIPTRIAEAVMEFIPDDMKEVICRFDRKIQSSGVTKYGRLLEFIKPLEEYPDKLARWHGAEMRKDKDGRNLLMSGYPIYESDTLDFLDAMRSFTVNNYVEVIESYGIKYKNIDILRLDLAKYDDRLVLAMITAIVRSERISEGLIMSMIQNGSLLKLLLRLREFDVALPKEDIITKIRYSFSCFGDVMKNEGFVIDIVSKDKVRIEYRSYRMVDSIQPVVVLDEADSKTLITKLYNLNILDWQEHYEPAGIIMDGESWDMEIDTYNLGHIRKGGNNAFPENWHSFRNFRRWMISRLKNS